MEREERMWSDAMHFRDMARVRGQISKKNHAVLMCRSTQVLVSREVSDEGKRCLKFSAAVVGENRRSVNKRKGPEIWDRFFH